MRTRKLLALAVFNIGCVLESLGAFLQGETKKHRTFIRWRQRVERRSLMDAFNQHAKE